MATLPLNDPARQALVEEGENALKILDQYTAEGQQKAEAEVTVPVQEKPAEIRPPSMQERLDALEPLIDGAVDSGNEAGVRRLCQEGRDAVRSEKKSREDSLQNAEDYFNEALKEYGESADETNRAAAEVANWKKSLEGFDGFITDQDVYYDAVIAQMSPMPPTPEQAIEPAVVAPVEKKERAKTLQEALDVLEKAVTAYKLRLAELEAQKKDMASKIVEERIAKLKAELEQKT